MDSPDRLYTCRRLRNCRAKLPGIDLERDSASNALVCKPGRCPSARNHDSASLINLQIELRKARQEARDSQLEKERLLAHVASLQDQLDTALEIRAIATPIGIDHGMSTGRSQAVPVLMCTDWHCGAVVKPETVNNLNQYNVEIFHERAEALFRNALRVVNMLRSTSDVKQMVVFLGGDLIDNWLHPEQIQLQELSPTQQLIECEKAVVQGLDYLVRHGDLERIVVPCCYGNHGRTTPKMQADNAHATSYEWLMYQSLRRHFRQQSAIEWSISDGNVLYLDVLGQKLRFTHGDAIRYGGGVGGISVPLQKWLYRQDVGIKADHTFMGHFHTLTHGPNWTVNGSLIGPTAYGLKLGFAPERPQQGMRVIDSERGFTINAPILTD